MNLRIIRKDDASDSHRTLAATGLSPQKKWRRAGSSDRRNAWLTDGRARWTGGVFEGVEYATRGEMCAARRRRYVEHLEAGMNFTQAARAVGVSKRTGKVWRNGRTRSNGRNEKPSVDWYRSTVDIPQKISSRYLSQDERISIADWRKAGMSVRGIARTLNRPASTASRELVRNTNPATGMYEPYRPQQMSADGPDDPSPRRSIRCPACSHTFAQDCGRIGVPSRSRGACAPISRIMMLCMCARRRSTRPSTSRPKAN